MNRKMSLANLEIDEIARILEQSSKILQENHFMIEHFVIDYFSENIWDKLPPECCQYIDEATLDDFARLIDFRCKEIPGIPQSLQEIRKRIIELSLPRERCVNINPMKFDSDAKYKSLHDHLTKPDSPLMTALFRRIKKKKRHEITIMSEISFHSYLATEVDVIIDVGAGLGHLSRMLTYFYGMKLVAIDGNPKYKSEAEQLDKHLQRVIAINIDGMKDQMPEAPIHITLIVEGENAANDFINVIAKACKFKPDKFTFGIMGLHPCGDLAPTLLRIYSNCSQCKFINLASCCYMKLSTEVHPLKNTTQVYGFPMSSVSKDLGIMLSHNSRELSCHAIENYIKKLLEKSKESLKVHAYRAILEDFLVKIDPAKKHCQIKSVKYKDNMTFQEYCGKALSGLGMTIDFSDKNVDDMLMEWKRVVGFYCLRVLFAPLIETIILLDRYLYLKLNVPGTSDIKPFFDPSISPRVHLLTAKK